MYAFETDLDTPTIRNVKYAQRKFRYKPPRWIFFTFKSLKPMCSDDVSRDARYWTPSLEAWEPENILALPFTRCEKIARLADYRVPNVYSRCKIIQWFSNIYDPQQRLIGSHSRLFCGNLYGLRFPHIFAANRAKDAFLRDAGKDNAQRNRQNSRTNTRTSFHRFWIPGCPSVLEFVRGGTSSDEGLSSIPSMVDHELNLDWYLPRCSPCEGTYIPIVLLCLVWIECGITDW